MLTQREAFAVEDGVPAEAAAHAVHFTVQIPAAVRAGIEQFILPAVDFEVRHADAGQPHRHAACEQLAEEFFGDDEQFALVVGWFAEAHRLMRGKMVDVTESQFERARLLAVFAQGRADALAEILDQAAEKFRVDGAAFDGGFAGNGFWRGGQEHFAAVAAAGALPDLLTDGFAEGRFERGLRHAAQLADRGDAALGQRPGVHVADAVELFHGQRRQESLFLAGSDHAEAAWALQSRRDRGDHFCACRAKRNAESRFLENFHLQAHQRPAIVWIEALGAGEVEVKVVKRSGFDGWRVGFQDAPHAFGKIGVVFVLSGHDDGFGANAQRFAEAHRGVHTLGFCLVACRSDAATPHQHGLAAQPRIQHLLDRGEKRVYVYVHDVGNFGCRAFAPPKPGPGQPWTFLRCRFGLRLFRQRRVRRTRRAIALRYFLFWIAVARAFRPEAVLCGGANAPLHGRDGGAKSD